MLVKERNTVKQIKVGAILSYLSIFINILSGLIYTPWMVKQIGHSQYGIYTLANSIITLFLFDFGLSSAVSRYLSKYHAEGDEEQVNNFLGVAYKLYAIIDTVIFVLFAVLFFLIDSIYVKLTPEELKQLKVVFIIVASFSVFNFPFITFNGVLTAYEKFIPLKVADIIYRFILIALTIFALFFGLGLYALVAAHVISGIIVVIFKFVVIKRTIKIKVNWRYKSKTLYRDIFSFSIWVTISSLAQRLIFTITPSILAVVANSAAIAIFGVVSVIEGYIFTVTGAINGMFMPRISRIYATGDENADITPLLLKIGKFQFILNGLLIVGFAVVGKLFISLWVGDSYIDAFYGILLVIIPGLFFNSLQIGNTAMVVKNKVKYIAYVNLATGIVNVVCSFLLSSRYGVIGACFSIFIAYIFRAIVLNITFRNQLKLNLVIFIKECYIKMSIPIILSILIGYFINQLIFDTGWLSFVVKAMIIVIVYLILMFILGLKKQDKVHAVKHIKSIIKKK